MDLSILEELCNQIRSNKCLDVVAIDVRGLCTFADYFVVCTGLVSTHVELVSKDMIRWLKSKNVSFHKASKNISSNWSSIDCGSVVIHIFSPVARSTYDIESMWDCGKIINV